MSSKKDKMIDELFKVIQDKKSAIEKTERAKWQTNCSFAFGPNDSRINIQTVSEVKVIVGMYGFLMNQSDAFHKASEKLGVDVVFEWQGFTFDQWENDFKTRVEKIQITTKKKELNDLTSRLDKLVSKEKREEMELLDIQKELGVK